MIRDSWQGERVVRREKEPVLARVRTSTARKLRALTLLVLSTVGLTGCTDWALYDLDYVWGYIPFLSVLREDVALDPYEAPRLPPEHAVPVATPDADVPPTFAGYPFFSHTQLDSVAPTLSNPLQPTPEVLAEGREEYLSKCAVCHGPAGAGDGTIVGGGRFPFASPLNAAGAAARSDGYIYAIISTGRGLMPPQGYKLSDLEQWAVVWYVRQLQQEAGVAPVPTAPAPAEADTAAVATAAR